MNIAECNHIRIRDSNNYGMNVERTIKHLEDIYQIDFRTLPQWEKLVQRLHLAITDCKRKIQDSKRRKATIIDKIFIQSYRGRWPFELTDVLHRTAKKWLTMEDKMKMTKKSIISLTKSVNDINLDASMYCEIQGEESLGFHPNTEVLESSKPTAEIEEFITTLDSHLPDYVCLNQHKRLSLLQSDDSSLSFESSPAVVNVKYEKGPAEWLVLPNTTNIISAPNKITIENESLEEQTISFSLTNCSQYPYLNLRYKGVTDSTQFRRAKIIPVTPVKLFPGIAVHFKFVFKLKQNPEDFAVNLFFKIGQKVLAEAPLEGFNLPVNGIFSEKPEAIEVSEEVNIPSIYLWHLNSNNGFPCSKVTVNVMDRHCYNLCVTKMNMNLIQETGLDTFSIKPLSPSSTTIAQKEQDQEIIAQSKTIVSNDFMENTESALTINSIAIIINDAIQRALDVFVFEKTFLPLQPFSNQSIRIYQTKAEHIGFHQSLYEFNFSNPVTNETVLRKTVKVFGEVLPNPVQIVPSFLDMTMSPIAYGRCEDHFTIINSHKRVPVTIEIKLTTKMKQLIRITPMKTFIAARSHVNFLVDFCSKDLNKNVIEDFVYLTIKIIVKGDKLVYRNLPPMFYEIIAPCSSEFIKLYKKEEYA